MSAHDEADRIAASAVRRFLLPQFRALGFQRVTGAVCERWCGDDAANPWQYIRFHLSREGSFSRDRVIGFVPDLQVFYPFLDSRDAAPRLDRKNRFSPSLRNVYDSRHSLTLAHSTKHPAWRGCEDTIAARIEEMSSQLATLLIPAIRRFDDPGTEIERQRDRGLLTPDAVREKVDRELSTIAELESAGRNLGCWYPGDAIDYYKLYWSTRGTPAWYANSRLRRIASRQRALKRYDAALAEQARSLWYTADYAARLGCEADSRQFENLARDMEDAIDAGTRAVAMTGRRMISRRG